METIISIVGGSIILVLLGIFALFKWEIFKFYRTIREFVTPPAKNQPSPLGGAVSAVSDQIARSIVSQAKATFMAGESAAVRADKAVQGDIAVDVASQNPLVSGLMAQFPTLKKSLRRNPQLLETALSYLASRQSGGVPGNGSSSQAKFKL
jgi:hypothetical protein